MKQFEIIQNKKYKLTNCIENETNQTFPSRDQLEGHVRRLQEELQRERDERNFYQVKEKQQKKTNNKLKYKTPTSWNAIGSTRSGRSQGGSWRRREQRCASRTGQIGYVYLFVCGCLCLIVCVCLFVCFFVCLCLFVFKGDHSGRLRFPSSSSENLRRARSGT